MAIRLNGWQRLWVVVSAIYLVPVGAAGVLSWPTAETTWHRDEFITRMPAELKAHVDAAYENEYAWSKQHHYPGEKTVELKKTPKGKVIPPPPDFVLVSAPVKLANGAVLDLRAAKDGDTEPDARVAPAYWAIVQAEARAERWRWAWYLALAWLVPWLALYALGRAVAWVRRGFSKPSPT
jgi:hypothetical protein